ncbi:MAG: hypothetical protein F6K31_16680 [Symploca sp. SIO2G7]|nr:hypothetical protein [Symploca sp. SIO2G7]
MAAAAAVVPLLEIAVVCLGLFVWLRSRTPAYSVAAALSLGIMSGLGLLSCLLQIGFLMERPDLIPLLELVVLTCIIVINRKRWRLVSDIPKRLTVVWQEAPITGFTFAIALGYLFLQAVLLPPNSWDAMTYHLPRVLLWEQNHSLLLRDYAVTAQAIFPVGSDILFHLFLRFQTDYGLGVFSWLSYGAIVFGVYAIARPRVTPTIALTTAIVIACLPEIVYQSTATKNDIIVAAVAVVCVVWADRWLMYPTIESTLGLGLTLCFGIAVKTSFVLFGFFFMLLWLSLVVQRGYLERLLRLLITHWRIVLACTLPALVLSQGWLFLDNYHQYGTWLGPPEFALKNQNRDGLLGGVANFIRYGFQSIHLLQPVDWGWQSLTAGSIQAKLQAVYDGLFDPWLGRAGYASFVLHLPLEIKWQAQEDTSWFGPVSVFLIFPAVVWTLVRGKELPRIMSIITLCLVGVISYKIGWSPWKCRFFTPVFVGTGLCVAVFLQRLRLKTWGLAGLRWISLAILIYGCLYNFSKPLILPPNSPNSKNIWLQSNWTQNRLVYAHLYHGPQVELQSQALTSAKRVAMVGYAHYFPLMFYNPHLEFLLLHTPTGLEGSQAFAAIEPRLTEVDHLLCFHPHCDPTEANQNFNLVWKNQANNGFPKIYRVLANGIERR